MPTVLAFLRANWPTLVAPALLVALSLLNRRLPYAAMRNGPAVARAMGALIDWLAATTRADSPGSLALPFLQVSAPPVPDLSAAAVFEPGAPHDPRPTVAPAPPRARTTTLPTPPEES